MTTRELIQELLDLLLAQYDSEQIGELVYQYEYRHRKYGMEDAWAHFTDRFELGNWIYEQAIMADINLPEFLIDTQTARSLREQQAAEDMEERRLEYRSSVGGGSL